MAGDHWSDFRKEWLIELEELGYDCGLDFHRACNLARPPAHNVVPLARPTDHYGRAEALAQLLSDIYLDKT